MHFLIVNEFNDELHFFFRGKNAFSAIQTTLKKFNVVGAVFRMRCSINAFFQGCNDIIKNI